MAPKVKLGAKPGAKSDAKFGTKHGAKWCLGAKPDTAIMLHRPSVSLHRARSNVVQKPERSIGIRQHLVSILLQRSQHLATLGKHIAARDQHLTTQGLHFTTPCQHFAHINANG